MRYLDFTRLLVILALSYGVKWFYELIHGYELWMPDIFQTALLLVILWAVRDGQRSKA